MILDMFHLRDRVAIITGAGRGIGAAIATAFAEVGADVVIGARTESQLVEVADAVKRAGRRAAVVPGDLSTRTGMALLVQRALDAFGGLDIVVNNAGGSMPMPFLSTTEEHFNAALLWNVTTAFNLTQLAVPHLLARGGGSVINIASAIGRFPDRGYSAYGTAKAALVHLTKNLACDLAPKIRVNAIAPGAIATSALDIVLTNDALKNEMIQSTPLKRIGVVDDIAAGAVYLASAASAYVTGRVIDIDGGVRKANLNMRIADL